jgi:hypothetical protein
MKKVIFIFLCFLLSCNKKADTATPISNQKPATISIKTSASPGNFWVTESPNLVLSVDLKDEKGAIIQNYSGKITFTANDKDMTDNQYTFNTEGQIIFKAKVDNLTSDATGTFIVKDPAKELDHIEVANGFYQKYAVNHTLIGSKPDILIKGFSKNGIEIPIAKGLKASLGTENIILENYAFAKNGTQKIAINAYGKTSDLTFNVRANNRIFDLVRIPLIFHFCKPGPFVNPSVNISDEQYMVQALAQLKSGEIIDQLNKMYRNKFVANSQSIDPNAADSFIEFYLADKGPDGKALAQNGVNKLDFTKPYVAPGGNYDKNSSEAKAYETKLVAELSKWNMNEYMNIVIEPFGGWGYAGIGKNPFMDNARKTFIPKEYFDLPYSLTSDQILFKDGPNTNFYDHIRLNGSKNVLTSSDGFVDKGLLLNSNLVHELGHVFGLPHTFWRAGDCNEAQHSDGLFDTPKHFEPNYSKSCDNIIFTQTNMMNYNDKPTKGYFTYDQVTVMRARIEAQFNIPSPRNKGKVQGGIKLSLSQNQSIID